MCTMVILFRPGHAWPLIVATNRDERTDRPWKPPGRHWPDRPRVTAGLDLLAGGTWLGMNDYGVLAGVLNRPQSLGPRPHFRSRGELPLEALDHASAADAAQALSHIEPVSFRPFNMVIADAGGAFWLRNRGDGTAVEVMEIEAGLSMITAHDLNDPASPRMARYLPLFRAAPPPDPGAGDWSTWPSLMAARDHDAGHGPEAALLVAGDGGFGTVSSSLMALGAGEEGAKVWLFAPGPPGEADYEPLSLA
jgi:hypothetical protein